MLRFILVLLVFMFGFNINAMDFVKSHADTLLSIYIADLAEKNSVEEVVNYAFIDYQSTIIFYANILVKSQDGSKLEPREVTIKHHKLGDLTDQENLSLIDAASISYMCGVGTDCSTKCKFVEGRNETSYNCTCLENVKNGGCSVLKTKKDELWDEAKYNEGKSILANIKVSEYAGILNSIPE